MHLALAVCQCNVNAYRWINGTHRMQNNIDGYLLYWVDACTHGYNGLRQKQSCHKIRNEEVDSARTWAPKRRDEKKNTDIGCAAHSIKIWLCIFNKFSDTFNSNSIQRAHHSDNQLCGCTHVEPRNIHLDDIIARLRLLPHHALVLGSISKQTLSPYLYLWTCKLVRWCRFRVMFSRI